MKNKVTILLGTLCLSLGLQADEPKPATPVEVPEKIQKAITKADTDKSGDLSVTELGAMIRKNTLRHLKKEKLEGEALIARAKEVEAAKFKVIDTDGNGAVSAAEYAVARAKAAERKAKKKAEEAKDASKKEEKAAQ